MATLYVETTAQKVLLDLELKGQISDGNWENATPHGHFKPWCNAEVVVSSEKIGRDFYAQKDNYNFACSDLLECVGDRMLQYVRAARVYGIENAYVVVNYGMGCTYEGKHYDEIRAKLATMDLSKLAEVLKDETLYSMKQMKADLKGLKTICKIQIYA